MHLNKFAVTTLRDRYMAPQDKEVEDIFRRSIETYCTGEHKERMLSYVLNNLFVGSTPVLANAGTGRVIPLLVSLALYLTADEVFSDITLKQVGLPVMVAVLAVSGVIFVLLVLALLLVLSPMGCFLFNP